MQMEVVYFSRKMLERSAGCLAQSKMEIQSDQFGRFIRLWATFQSLWRQLV